MSGSHNGTNFLQQSPVFSRLVEGQTSECNFEINNHKYTKGYVLPCGWYLSCVVHTCEDNHPLQKKRNMMLLAREQEACRKDESGHFVSFKTTGILFCTPQNMEFEHNV
jgi:hypothetical protein